MTTVKELKKSLEGLDDDAPIFIRDREHNHDIRILAWLGKYEYYTVDSVTW